MRQGSFPWVKPEATRQSQVLMVKPDATRQSRVPMVMPETTRRSQVPRAKLEAMRLACFSPGVSIKQISWAVLDLEPYYTCDASRGSTDKVNLKFLPKLDLWSCCLTKKSFSRSVPACPKTNPKNQNLSFCPRGALICQYCNKTPPPPILLLWCKNISCNYSGKASLGMQLRGGNTCSCNCITWILPWGW